MIPIASKQNLLFMTLNCDELKIIFKEKKKIEFKYLVAFLKRKMYF